MAINANLNGAGTMCPPTGYPVRLFAASDTMLQGVISPWVSTVTATVQTEKGSANAHMALFTMPTSSGGNDGALVSGTQVDAAVLSTTEQTLTVTVPTSGVALASYIVRLWVDSITGSNGDTISRDGSTATSLEPVIPVAVLVNSMTVS